VCNTKIKLDILPTTAYLTYTFFRHSAIKFHTRLRRSSLRRDRLIQLLRSAVATVATTYTLPVDNDSTYVAKQRDAAAAVRAKQSYWPRSRTRCVLIDLSIVVLTFDSAELSPFLRITLIWPPASGVYFPSNEQVP